MRKLTLTAKLVLLSTALFFSTGILKAQSLLNNDSAYKAGIPNSGRIWGYEFSDFYYKGHSDSLNRGGSNQYSGIPASRTAFQARRIYLGYDYNISTKFSAELLLAAENDYPAGNAPATTTTATGDLLQNSNLSFYIKLANLRWKNLWKGTDLVIGQAATPAFPMLTEKIWNYRDIERTISDIRRTPSFDMGATLQGKFDPNTGNFGYDLMVGNGGQAKPEGDNFKWFYGDVYGKFLNQHLIIDLYADYERLNWVYNWHHSRQMLKAYIAYTSKPFTVGVEGFINNLKNDNFATKIAGGVDTLSVEAKGISFYAHGEIIPDKLRIFARLDLYNPNNIVNTNVYSKYVGNTSNYNDNSYDGTNGTTPTGDETYKQMFITAGLDFAAAKNVHIMPNIWYDRYSTQLATANTDHDLVYRMTIFYAFGKDYSKQYYKP
jgi:hypothetical protein